MSRTLLPLSALVASLFACQLAVAQPQPGSDKTPLKVVRIGYLPQMQDVAVIALRERLGPQPRVEFVRFDRYADAEAALSRGEVHVASLSYESLPALAARGAAPKFTYVAGLARGGVSMVCRKDVKIGSWADLRGHNLAITPGMPEWFLDDALTQHELKPQDIYRIKTPADSTPMKQIEAGDAECAVVNEPAAALGVAKGFAHYPAPDIADNAYGGIQSGLAVNAGFLKNQRPLVQNLVRELAEATSLFQRDADQWVQRLVSAKAMDAAPAAVGIERVWLDIKLYPDEAWAMVGAAVGAGKAPAGRGAVDAYFDTTLLD